MTDNDKELIKIASEMDCIHWAVISNKMVQQAVTEEAKDELQKIAKKKYHLEEYESDNL